MNNISVLIAEDHTIVCEGICALMEKEKDIEVIGKAEHGRDAILLCKELSPDIVIMDISMPLLNGIDATRIITKEILETKVIILSMYHDELCVINAIEAGASGFLVKQTAAANLVTAIREVYNGRVFYSPEVQKIILNNFWKAGMVNEGKLINNINSTLTLREREVLQLIAEGFSSTEIAKELFISKNTVRSHRDNIMRKLEIHNTVQLVHYAIEKGIIRIDHPGL